MGVDCAGLVLVSLREAGYRVSSNVAYGSQPRLEDLLSAATNNLRRVTKPMDGDMIAISLVLPHCGILDGDGFWHAHRSRPVIWTPLRGIWKRGHVATFGVR